MRFLTQEEQEFLIDFMTMSKEDSQDKEFEVQEVVDEYLVITTEGEVEVNPDSYIDVEYNKAIARQSNNDTDKELYNKALEKQKDRKRRVDQKRKETGLKLV